METTEHFADHIVTIYSFLIIWRNNNNNNNNNLSKIKTFSAQVYVEIRQAGIWVHSIVNSTAQYNRRICVMMWICCSAQLIIQLIVVVLQYARREMRSLSAYFFDLANGVCPTDCTVRCGNKPQPDTTPNSNNNKHH